MAIFALGDLHLSHNQEKPMDIFGSAWENHNVKIKENWDGLVDEDDLVIIPGDISWAMRLPEAIPDLIWLSKLKGTKLLIRGNHDYWWSSIGKVRAYLPSSVYALQNDHLSWDNWAVCGTRGWICPGEESFDHDQDQKIYEREIQRLQLSLESARQKRFQDIIVALHFPPFNRKGQSSAFTGLLEDYKVKYCLFGHIHDEGRDHIYQGLRNGVKYLFVAADGNCFTPVLVV